MSRWWRAYDDALDNRELQTLSAERFKAAYYARLAGSDNEFSPFLKPCGSRPAIPDWAGLRSHVFRRDDYTCTYCGSRGGILECDHVVPVARGGGNGHENLTTACRPCNRSKRDKLVSEWTP